MPSKSKRPKDSKSKQSLDMDIESEHQQVNKEQNKDIEMDEDLNLDVEQNDDTDLDLKDETQADVSKKSKPKRGKKGVCVKCNETKIICYCSMCHACYRKHLKAKHEQEGQEEAKNLVICLKCNLLKKHCARKLCHSCYKSVRKDPEKLKQYPKTLVRSCKGQQAVCVKCNEQTKLYRFSMCRPCYKKDKRERRKAGAQKCGNCGKLKVLEQNGFCSDCNSDERIKEVANRQRLETILKNIQENEFIASVDLTVHSSLASNPKFFEQFGKIKINFLDVLTLNSVDLNDNGKNSGSIKYLVSNEDFLSRLKQYTSSKLKPLKKQSNSLNKKNASSIFNVVEKKEPVKSSPKAKQSSKIKTPSKSRKVNLRECVDCKQMKPHNARGLCRACYKRFMRRKKKEDAEKAKTSEQVEEKSSRNVEAQNTISDQAEAPSGKPKKKRAKKQSSDV